VFRSELPGDARWWLWTCTVGLVMGLFALWYVPFLKGNRARAAARHADGIARGDDPPYPPGADPMKSKNIGPATDYSSRESGSNTVSSTETPGSSTRS
jgi:hypothetical protein